MPLICYVWRAPRADNMCCSYLGSVQLTLPISKQSQSHAQVFWQTQSLRLSLSRTSILSWLQNRTSNQRWQRYQLPEIWLPIAHQFINLQFSNQNLSWKTQFSQYFHQFSSDMQCSLKWSAVFKLTTKVTWTPHQEKGFKPLFECFIAVISRVNITSQSHAALHRQGQSFPSTK